MFTDGLQIRFTWPSSSFPGSRTHPAVTRVETRPPDRKSRTRLIVSLISGCFYNQTEYNSNIDANGLKIPNNTLNSNSGNICKSE
jgi:hypothetical protein